MCQSEKRFSVISLLAEVKSHVLYHFLTPLVAELVSGRPTSDHHTADFNWRQLRCSPSWGYLLHVKKKEPNTWIPNWCHQAALSRRAIHLFFFYNTPEFKGLKYLYRRVNNFWRSPSPHIALAETALYAPPPSFSHLCISQKRSVKPHCLEFMIFCREKYNTRCSQSVGNNIFPNGIMKLLEYRRFSILLLVNYFMMWVFPSFLCFNKTSVNVMHQLMENV